ncbi:MAG: IS200/IS605 family element transposase accessory protein TnpB [Boseongicola sp. SB0662_bin_57]|nr:IS200/IS605 family element transposase accessory protein TnpB [Boseongicola sp. SB0662_bin_57]
MTDEAQPDAGIKRIRTVTLTASIGAATHCRLDAFLRQQAELWNAALEERIDCHRKTGKTITAFDQMKSLTEIRRDDDDFSQFHAATQRSVLLRLDKAFKRFFDQVRRGERPGFPRFKGRNRGIRSFDVPDPVIRDGSLWLKGIGRFRLPSVPDAKIVQARVVKSALRVSVQFVVELEQQPSVPVGEPIGIDMGIHNRAIMSSGETVPAVTIDRRPLKRAQRVVARAKKGSVSRRRKVKALAREWERTRIRERNALHEISASIVKRHRRIAVEDLQVSNMMRHPTLARPIAEQQWGRLVQQLTYKAESAGGEVVRVRPQHTSTDCHACGHRQPMPLDVREFACGGCDLVTDRDVNAARNVLRRGVALAGWEVGPSGRPGASESVLGSDVAGLPGQGAERCPAESQPWI